MAKVKSDLDGKYVVEAGDEGGAKADAGARGHTGAGSEGRLDTQCP